MKEIQKILIPIDFTEHSEYAYTVARQIAEKSGADIVALTVVSGPHGTIYAYGDSKMSSDRDQSEWIKRLEVAKNKLEAWVRDKEGISICHASIGNVAEVIIEFAEDGNMDLIIMATGGEASNSWNKGSNTVYITNNTEVPVLSLKSNRSHLKMDRILYVSSFLENTKEDLSVLKAIQHAFNAELCLLKILTPSSNALVEEVESDMESFAQTNNLENYSLHTYSNDDVEHGIEQFSAKNSIDLVAIGTHQWKGFSKLFRKSISDDLVSELEHPLLTFPI